MSVGLVFFPQRSPNPKYPHPRRREVHARLVQLAALQPHNRGDIVEVARELAVFACCS